VGVGLVLGVLIGGSEPKWEMRRTEWGGSTGCIMHRVHSSIVYIITPLPYQHVGLIDLHNIVFIMLVCLTCNIVFQNIVMSSQLILHFDLLNILTCLLRLYYSLSCQLAMNNSLHYNLVVIFQSLCHVPFNSNFFSCSKFHIGVAI
jgi:hypothetical protein